MVNAFIRSRNTIYQLENCEKYFVVHFVLENKANDTVAVAPAKYAYATQN